MCKNCKKSSFRKRFFADFMAKEDAKSFEQYKNKKEQLFKNINGKVLEIGPGTGVNLRFFPKAIEWIGLEPNEAMHPYLKQEAIKRNINATFLKSGAETIGLADNSVDFVVSTVVLCSVYSVAKTLEEIQRVLKPAGKFLFLEHQADKAWTFRWMVQKIVPYTPWRYFSDGCTPGRKLDRAIEKAGFSNFQYQKYMQEGKGLILAINRPHLYGWAQK